jgi:two-component system sensor histidine kinase KdpD
MGGELTVGDTPGGGTTMVISLPVAADQPAPASPTAALAAAVVADPRVVGPG